MNAAVWLGATIFFTFGAEPGCFSADMNAALNITGDSYYPGAISQVIMSRYYHVALACAVVALLHLVAEWLYMGKPARKFSFGLLAALFVLAFIGGNAIQPALTRLNKQHYTAAQTAERVSAGRSFHAWDTVLKAFNILTIAGLVVHVWRVANPSDTLRFVHPVQFRG
jgi:hypothetical protein